jgi:hypothetical protein
MMHSYLYEDVVQVIYVAVMSLPPFNWEGPTPKLPDNIF